MAGARRLHEFVSSTLLAVEARRGTLRYPPASAAAGRIWHSSASYAQIEMDGGTVVETASRLPDPMLRSLDAHPSSPPPCRSVATSTSCSRMTRACWLPADAHGRTGCFPRVTRAWAPRPAGGSPRRRLPGRPLPRRRAAVLLRPPRRAQPPADVRRPLERRSRRGSTELDRWLARHDAAPLAGRVPLLSYGSNRNPSKITWLRDTLGLTGPVVVLRARTEGLAAVWASGFRARDGQRTSVLGAAPGASEHHALWFATPDQVAVLDRCEGRGDRYRLARLGMGAVHTDDGLRIEAPWCYLGRSAIRRPLLVGGRPVRCADLAQAAALTLDGVAAPDDGLAAVTVEGAPHPDEWPAALFVYGTLQPGQPAWPLLSGHAVGRPRAATVAGEVRDTGRGYPALLPGGPAGAPGQVITVRDPVALLRRLDATRGPSTGGSASRRRRTATRWSPPAGRTPGQPTRRYSGRCRHPGS